MSTTTRFQIGWVNYYSCCTRPRTEGAIVIYDFCPTEQQFSSTDKKSTVSKLMEKLLKPNLPPSLDRWQSLKWDLHWTSFTSTSCTTPTRLLWHLAKGTLLCPPKKLPPVLPELVEDFPIPYLNPIKVIHSIFESSKAALKLEALCLKGRYEEWPHFEQ